MPDPKDKAKMTGDTHPPEVESELPLSDGTGAVGADGTPRGRTTKDADEAVSGRDSSKTEGLKDRDAQTSNSYGQTRDSGEGPGGGRS